MDLEEHLKDVLETAFPGATIQLEGWGPRVGGSIVWEGFDNLDQLDRQRQLRNAIDSNLSEDELNRVSLILTLTHHEKDVLTTR